VRFHLAEPDDSPEVKAVLAELAEAGPVSDLQRALANSPGAARAYVAMSRYIRLGGGLENELRELVILRVQQHLLGEYEWRRHVVSALRVGVTEDQVRALQHWSSSQLFSPRQQASLALTDASVTRHGLAAAMAAVGRDFDWAETVELCMLIGFYSLGAALILPFDLIDGDSAEPAPLAMFADGSNERPAV